MGDIEYEIIEYNIKDFEYRSPKAFIDENGECQIKYDKDLMTLGSITLLQRHTLQNGKLVNIESIKAANNFLLHKKINDELTSLSTYSTALIHYFHFLETQTIGLGECPHSESCEKCNKQPMKWDEMPFRNSDKPTYKYRKHLKAIYASNEPDDNDIDFTKRAKEFVEMWLVISEKLSGDYKNQLLLPNITNDGTLGSWKKNPPQNVINQQLARYGYAHINSSRFRKTRSDILMRVMNSAVDVAAANNTTVSTARRSYLNGVEQDHQRSLVADEIVEKEASLIFRLYELQEEIRQITRGSITPINRY